MQSVIVLNFVVNVHVYKCSFYTSMHAWSLIFRWMLRQVFLKLLWLLLVYMSIFDLYDYVYVLIQFQFRNFKIVYRRYAGLYFCICVDVSDNNLMYLEAIHNFVEVLNEYFHNVCELDLVFNFYKVWFDINNTIIKQCI